MKKILLAILVVGGTMFSVGCADKKVAAPAVECKCNCGCDGDSKSEKCTCCKCKK